MGSAAADQMDVGRSTSPRLLVPLVPNDKPSKSQASASFEGCQAGGDGPTSAFGGVAGSGDGYAVNPIGGGSLSLGAKQVCSSHEPTAYDVTSEATSGWTRRVRIGKAPVEREVNPNRQSALEVSMRAYICKRDGNVVNPAIGTSFDSLDEAYQFYNLFSWEVGFGIKYAKSRLNVHRSKCMQEIVCGCPGKPMRENSISTRTECGAMIRLLRSEDNGWYICEHRDKHNHNLSATCGEKMHWQSHRHIDRYAKDLVKQLRQNNVSLGKVFSIVGSFFGSIENVPFTKRSLKTLCRKINKERSDFDARKTMHVLADMKREDPDFSYSVQVDEQSRIKTLMWVNGRSVDQYRCFGDAITFDTTYMKNLYDMPFGLFVGGE